jgi:pSer/pThr/pTyr-binding forkhead associated (FHA) protein
MKLCAIVNEGAETLTCEIDGEAISIGRSKENDIEIHDPYVSRHHLILWPRRNKFLLKNLSKRNGTKVGSHRVLRGGTVEVKEGDAIKIGKTVFCLGQGSTGGIFAFLQSIYSPEQGASGETTTLYKDTIS